MKTTQSKAEIYLMALNSLSKAERAVVIEHLLDDDALMEDILDIALAKKRLEEPSRPFEDFLAEEKKRSR